MKHETRNIALITLLLISLLWLSYLGLSNRWDRQALVEAHGADALIASHRAAPDWNVASVATDTTPTATFTATTTRVATQTTTPTLTPTSTATRQPGPSTVVEIRDFQFRPATIFVPPHTSVVWNNRDNVRHTVASDTGDWETIDLAPGQAGFHIFENVGVFPYHCSIHPTMTGKVVVISHPVRRTYLPAVLKSFHSGP